MCTYMEENIFEVGCNIAGKSRPGITGIVETSDLSSLRCINSERVGRNFPLI